MSNTSSTERPLLEPSNEIIEFAQPEPTPRSASSRRTVAMLVLMQIVALALGTAAVRATVSRSPTAAMDSNQAPFADAVVPAMEAWPPLQNPRHVPPLPSGNLLKQTGDAGTLLLHHMRSHRPSSMSAMVDFSSISPGFIHIVLDLVFVLIGVAVGVPVALIYARFVPKLLAKWPVGWLYVGTSLYGVYLVIVGFGSMFAGGWAIPMGLLYVLYAAVAVGVLLKYKIAIERTATSIGKGAQVSLEYVGIVRGSLVLLVFGVLAVVFLGGIIGLIWMQAAAASGPQGAPSPPGHGHVGNSAAAPVFSAGIDGKVAAGRHVLLAGNFPDVDVGAEALAGAGKGIETDVDAAVSNAATVDAGILPTAVQDGGVAVANSGAPVTNPPNDRDPVIMYDPETGTIVIDPHSEHAVTISPKDETSPPADPSPSPPSSVEPPPEVPSEPISEPAPPPPPEPATPPSTTTDESSPPAVVSPTNSLISRPGAWGMALSVILFVALFFVVGVLVLSYYGTVGRMLSEELPPISPFTFIWREVVQRNLPGTAITCVILLLLHGIDAYSFLRFGPIWAGIGDDVEWPQVLETLWLPIEITLVAVVLYAFVLLCLAPEVTSHLSEGKKLGLASSLMNTGQWVGARYLDYLTITFGRLFTLGFMIQLMLLPWSFVVVPVAVTVFNNHMHLSPALLYLTMALVVAMYVALAGLFMAILSVDAATVATFVLQEVGSSQDVEGGGRYSAASAEEE